MTTREAFERGTETFNAHDLDGFEAVLAPDVVFHAPGGIEGRGRAACVDFYGDWMDAFPDAHVDVNELHVIGDVAVEEGIFSGTHVGTLRTPAAQIPPTGRHVEVDYVQVLRIRNGEHVSFNLIFDRLTMLEQLGLAPAPGPSQTAPAAAASSE
jgi:ketosteroid isomerase-like protein